MSVVLLVFAQLSPMLSVDDRAVFEPYRQCILVQARQQYPSGQTLKVIFDKAKEACRTQQAAATAELAIMTAKLTIDALAAGKHEPVLVDRIGILESEVLLEVANDFVPKVK